MTEGIQKLQQDLAYLQAMLQDLVNYLNSNVVYWPSLVLGVPDLTLGGYIMRQRRLQILADLFSEAQQGELERTVFQFKELTQDRIVTLEQKASLELGIRMNQWEQHLQDYRESEEIEKEYYKTDAQVRTIITDLMGVLSAPPYKLDPEFSERIHELDTELRSSWKVGDFIWPEAWIPAYGKGNYWFLYGIPIAKKYLD